MSEIGHNRPDMTETVGDVTTSLNDWMKDHPVVQSEEEAREAKLLLDRAKLAVKDLEDERERKVKPLNQQVQEINQYYRPSRDLLQKVLHELTRRVTDFIAKEQAIRIKAAEEARKKAKEAERAARDAERLESDTLSNAHAGVLDADVAEAARGADRAFTEYRKADRLAALAERETKVKVGGGFSRALSLKNRETLTVTDAISAINAIGMTDGIASEIIKAARAYRTIKGTLPPGIDSKVEQTA